MNPAPVEPQLDRIEEIQAELRRVILDGSLTEMEQLSAECHARLQALLGPQLAKQLSGESCRQRLEAILAAHRQLEQLTARLLPVVATELRKAHEARQVALRYSIQPAQAAASLARCTDVVS